MAVLSSSRKDTLGAPASCRLRGRQPASLYILVATFLAVGILGCTGDVVAQEVVDAEQAPKGVVIEEVGEGSALEKAGLMPGDVVWAWERLPKTPANPETAQERPVHGEIESAFDWMWLEVEQASRGTVRLVGEREGIERLFEIAMGEWGGKVRPRLPDRILELYIQGRDKVEAGEIEQGVELWRELPQLGESKADEHFRSWIQLRIGETYAKTRAWEEAVEAYLSALEEEETPAATVALWCLIGEVHESRSAFDQAEASYRSALKIAEATWGRSLHTTSALCKSARCWHPTVSTWQ